jgi:hypothetical protein
MRVVKCKVSHNFLGSIFRNEIDLANSELPKDTKVVSVRGKPKEEWFWVYFSSKEFIDIDLTIEKVPELTLWFGRRRE